MARLKPSGGDDDIPAELARFDPADWPTDGVSGWSHAALRWLAEHRGRSLPFGEYGDVVDVLRVVCGTAPVP